MAAADDERDGAGRSVGHDLAAGVLRLVSFADKSVLGLAGRENMREPGLPRQELGTAQAAFFALFSASALAVSALTRRVRTSVPLLVTAVLWSAARLPMAWAAAGCGTLVATRVPRSAWPRARRHRRCRRHATAGSGC